MPKPDRTICAMTLEYPEVMSHHSSLEVGRLSHIPRFLEESKESKLLVQALRSDFPKHLRLASA